MQYASLRLSNFTVFKQAQFDFVPGINVFVGENGTGKTHLLKALYCGFPTDYPLDPKTVNAGFLDLDVFQVGTIDELRSFTAPMDAQVVSIASYSTSNNTNISKPVFIPATDILAHTKYFVTTYDEYKIDFDKTYRDIISRLLGPEKRNQDNLGIDLRELTSGLALDLEEENERFYITTHDGRVAAPMVAEGVRKLATLVQLIKNGWIRPGSVLLWDEPEVNLNPILMGNLAKALLTLARAGVQIFLASHSDVFLLELELQAKAGDIRFFALELTSNGVVPHPSDHYQTLKPNKIAEAYDSIFDRQLTGATGRSRKVANGK